jgi:uncharacterized membrane protein YkoI
MKTRQTLVTLTTACALMLGTGTSQADENPEELARLIKSGELLSWEAAGKKAKELHPGARVSETDLDKEWTRYVYELEVVDRQGVEWDIDLDAKTGEVLQQERED